MAAIEKAQINGQVRVAQADPDDWDGFQYHFIVMDEAASRVEIDIENGRAFVNFGDAGFAARLSRLFDSFERNGTPVHSIPATT